MYAHVTTVLLQVVTGDPFDLCFRANGFTEFVDLLGLTESDIEALVYEDPGPPVRKKVPVPRGYTQRLKILIALYLKWSHKRPLDINIEDVTLVDFLDFRTSEYNPSAPFAATHRTVGTSTAPTGPTLLAAPLPTGGPTPAQQFDRGIKKDKDHYLEFNDEKYWDNFRRGVETTADIHGTSNILNGAYVPPPGDPNAVELFASQNRFMYAVWESKIKTDMGMSIVRSHEVDRTAQAVWRVLTTHQTTSTAGSITRQSLLTHLAGNPCWIPGELSRQTT